MTPSRSLSPLVALVVGLLVAAGLVGYLGTREVPAGVQSDRTEAPKPLPQPTVVTMQLPHDSFPVPYGSHDQQSEENRLAFIHSCTQCHSARLVFTQPRFPADKWAASVTKMVNVYKAPLTPDDQKKIVAYLTSVHGN